MKNIVITEDHGIEIPPAVIKKQKIYDKAEDKNVAAVMIFDGGDGNYYYEESCINEVPASAFLNLFEKGVIIKKPDGSRVTPDGIGDDGSFIFGGGGSETSPVVIQLGVDDIVLNPSNYRFTLSNDDVIERVHGALISAYHNKRPVYFDITYHNTGSEVVKYLNGYASIHGYTDMGTDSVDAVFSTYNLGNSLIYDFYVDAGYYGSDIRVDMSLKARK